MITIDVCFKKRGKIYKYLLINPSNFKINKEKPLVYTSGVLGRVPVENNLYPIKVERVDILPEIVTSQIVLLNNNNNIMIQTLGKISSTEEVKNKKEERMTTSEKVKTSIFSTKETSKPFSKKNLKQLDKDLTKILNKVRKRGY